jgi:hypothetical protein
VSPLVQPSHYGKQFPIMDIIPPLSWIEGVGVISYGAQSSFVVRLVQDGPCGILRGVYFQCERKTIVWSMQNWVTGHNAYQSV